MNRKGGNAVEDRLRIQEKALASLADAVRKREAALDEELADILRELKALKLYLSRYVPGFKEQFPSVQRKVR